MKQGRTPTIADGAKREPNSRAVSVDKVSGIGVQRVRTTPPTKELYSGRGFAAPMHSQTNHRSGSQGKHK